MLEAKKTWLGLAWSCTDHTKKETIANRSSGTGPAVPTITDIHALATAM